MGVTSIAWTDRSVNPIRARDKRTGKIGHHCEMVSEGCKNCYASALQKRFGLAEFSGPSRRETVEHFLDESKLQEVLRRKAPTKWFWADMTDLFGEWVSDEWLDLCFAVMAFTPQHTHQVLTKRPAKACEYLNKLGNNFKRLDSAGRDLGIALSFERIPLVSWPISSTWIGVSVENQKAADERVHVLKMIPASVRFLSVEPLLEHTALNLNGIDWVIVGGESGPHRRDCQVKWIQSVHDQCRAAGVCCFVRQDSGPRPGMQGRLSLELWNVKEFPTAGVEQ